MKKKTVMMTNFHSKSNVEACAMKERVIYED